MNEEQALKELFGKDNEFYRERTCTEFIDWVYERGCRIITEDEYLKLCIHVHHTR